LCGRFTRSLATDRIIAANQTLHQTPDTWAVPAGAGGGAGELGVRYQNNKFRALVNK